MALRCVPDAPRRVPDGSICASRVPEVGGGGRFYAFLLTGRGFVGEYIAQGGATFTLGYVLTGPSE